MSRFFNPILKPNEPVEDDTPDQHEAVSSWFLGPKAENYNYLAYMLNSIIQQHKQVRQNYYAEDKAFITQDIQTSEKFQANMQAMADRIGVLGEHLGRYSVPFWSPRYNGHMLADQSMPAILGYITTLFYNQNNVAFEASPLTTQLEMQVGQDLCGMLGYYVPVEKDSAEYPGLKVYPQMPEGSGSAPIAFVPVDRVVGGEKLPVSWGHITCDGSVANLESMWAARNLKHYPLALRAAMDNELSFIKSTFLVETCIGETKLFQDLVQWELLNLKVPTVLQLPTQLEKQYNISSTWLDEVMKKYTLQSLGLQNAMSDIKPGLYLGATTKHYSWPKGCAISGIGADNWKDIDVDYRGRIDINILRAALEECITEQQYVYAVVAIMGSTEEGSVDSVDDILNLRTEMQAKGLSFAVHCDGAWGGYFASALDRAKLEGQKNFTEGDIADIVPTLPLKLHTTRQLIRMADADSITIDPHKSGYVPYPAGGLCYKDGRMRYMLTWTSPYLGVDSTTENIGVFGVEGSKPGAAAVATWFSNKFIGLTPTGYGGLLGEAIFTCSRIAAEWTAMKPDPDDFIVVPFNLIPGDDPTNPETPTNPNPALDTIRQFIRTDILPKTNSEIKANPAAMDLLRRLGSDLNINAFACNFRLSPGGPVNDDLEESNYFNTEIIKALSVDTENEEVNSIPVFLMGTTFSQAAYKSCATTFKKRMGISQDGDLTIISNTVMSPFTTSNGFITTIMDAFTKVVREKVAISRSRNTVSPTNHSFIIQGTGQNGSLHLVYLPMFYIENHRKQLITTATISDAALQAYLADKALNPNKIYVLATQTPATLDDLLTAPWVGSITPFGEKDTIIATNVDVNNTAVIKQRGLRYGYRDLQYPNTTPFYLYGTPSEMHLDHVLVRAPNVMTSAENVQLTDLSAPLPQDLLSQGLILFVDDLYEASMQPLTATQTPSYFYPGATFSKVSIYKDTKPATTNGPGLLPDRNVEQPIAVGKLVLAEGSTRVFSESTRLNSDDPLSAAVNRGAWKKEVRDFIQLKGKYHLSYPLPSELKNGDLIGALQTLEGKPKTIRETIKHHLKTSHNISF